MHDEADVALVDAHAEGHRGDDHLDVVGGERVLHAPALVGGEAGVVGGGAHAVRQKLVGDLLGALAGEAVHDARLTRVPGQELLELVQRLPLVDHGVADVGAVEPGDEDRCVGEPEPGAHVVAGLGVGGGGAGEDGHAREEPAELPELDVLRAEVVAPLAHAVGLVDGEEGDAGTVRSRGGLLRVGPGGIRVGQAVQALEEPLGHERLGGDVQQVEAPAVQVAQDGARLVRLQRRVVGGGAYAGRAQGVDLVLHQRDERRDDDAGAGSHERGELVAEGLAAAGGHEHEGVASRDDVLDDILLMRTELGEAEDVAQQGASGGRRGGRRIVAEGRVEHARSLARLTDGARARRRRRRVQSGRQTTFGGALAP